jgi:phospholipid transport system substrate-binding protein
MGGLCELVQAEPSIPVTQFHEGLIRMMKLDSYAARSQLLSGIISSNFDIKTVARIAMGRQWRKLSPEDQETIIKLMTEVILSSYAGRFPIYNNQHFEILDQVPIKPGRAILRCKLITGNEVVDLDYQLTEVEDSWKIFDVVANGVSDLALKRATYSATFKLEGFGGVVEEIKQTIINNKDRSKVAP